jgi:hypothetical protein
MKKNYNAPVQKKGRGRMTNYKIQIKNKKSKGSHGLHQDSFRLQTMTALIKSFCRGSRGAVFSKSAPLAVGDKQGGENDFIPGIPGFDC